MNQAYWARNPQGPFATLIAVAATYCHPEVYDDAYPELIARARSAAPDDEADPRLPGPSCAKR